MAGYVVDNELAPEQMGENAVAFVPEPGQTYYILAIDGVEQPNLDAYETWDAANFAAEAAMNGLDEVDGRMWSVVTKTAE